jgi:hypothetical protein
MHKKNAGDVSPAATAHGAHPNRTSGICTLCRNSTVAPHFGVTAR